MAPRKRDYPYEDRAKGLRAARTKALHRLRAEQDERFQVLYDEEVARLGLEPRAHTEFKPRPRGDK